MAVDPSTKPFYADVRTLVAGPWHGSLHGELLCWQGWLRRLSLDYNRTIILTDTDKRMLYTDFASVVTTPEKAPLIDGATYVTQADVPVHWISHQPLVREQKLVRLGYRADDETDFPFYATICASTSGHFGSREWAKIIYDAPESMDIAWASDPLDMAMTLGGTDIRNESFAVLLDTVCRSKIVISPSNGVIALACLCGVPFITWVGAEAVNLYSRDWNPMQTPGIVFKGEPTTNQVRDRLADMMKLYYERQPEEAAYD